MSASNFNNLQMTVGIDPRQANQSLHKVAGTAQKQVQKVVDTQEASVNKVNQAVDKGAARVAVLRDRWNKVNAIINVSRTVVQAFVGSIDKVMASMNQVARIADTRQGFFGFGGDAETIKKVDKALLGTVNRLETLTQLREAAGVGITNKELVDMAKASAFMASQLGMSKSELLGMAAAGKLNETVWDKMGRSLKTVEQEVLKAQVAAGRSLTDTEKQALTIRLFIKEAKQASGGFKTSVSQASDEFARMSVQLSNVKETLGRQLLPLAVKFLKFISGALDKVEEVIKEIKGNIKPLKVDKDFLLAEKLLRKEMESGKPIKVKVKPVVEKSKTTDGAKTFNQFAMEAMQERLGRQAALRAQLRNFTRTALQAVQRTGGPVARLIGGLGQYSEQLLTVQSTWPRLADKVLGKTHAQLKLMKEQRQLTTSQFKASILLNQFRQAGTANLRKLLLGEKSITQALQASIAPASDVAQLAAIRAKETQTQKSVNETIVGLQTAQRLLAFEKDKHQRNALELMFKEADKLKEVGKERLAILKIQRKLIEAAIQERHAKARLDMDKGELDTQKRLLTAQQQLAELRGQDAAYFKFRQAEVELQKLELEISQKHITLRKQEADLLRAKGNDAEFNLQRLRIEHTKAQIKQMEKLHGLQVQINQEQANPAVASIMAKQTKQLTDGLIQGIGGNLVDIWGAIFAGDNVGAALGKIMFKVFETIGDTLIAAGTQTLLMGIASLVNPWIGANPAAIGVGAGMIAGGSLIKAGSIAAAAAVGNSTKGGGSASTASTRTPVSEPQSPARAPTMGGGQVVINAMLVDPYFEGNLEGRVTNLTRQMNKILPRTGVQLQPSLVG